MKTFRYSIKLMIMLLFLYGCTQPGNKTNTLKTDENVFVILTDEQVENIIRRSYQYVAMDNVNCLKSKLIGHILL